MPVPERDSKGHFVPKRARDPVPVPTRSREQELLERLVWLLERLLWQQAGSLKSFAQYRQQLREEDSRHA